MIAADLVTAFSWTLIASMSAVISVGWLFVRRFL
jgi:hypothetical protein